MFIQDAIRQMEAAVAEGDSSAAADLLSRAPSEIDWQQVSDSEYQQWHAAVYAADDVLDLFTH